MRVRWDKSVDMASIKLVDEIAPGAAEFTHAIFPSEVFDSTINLDFTADGVLLSIEVGPASLVLPKELLDQAEVIG